MKLCKDCQHYRRDWVTFLFTSEFARCAHPQAYSSGIVFVAGKPSAYCRLERLWTDHCGPDGKRHEPKQPTTCDPKSKVEP